MDDAFLSSASGNAFANSANTYISQAPDEDMRAGHIGNTGGSQAVQIRNPYLGINFIIATTGLYPSRT